MNNSTQVKDFSANLKELYPELKSQRKVKPVTKKLRTFFQQLHLGLRDQLQTCDNLYLDRLVAESRLLFPEIANPGWEFGHQIAWKFLDGWISTELDVLNLDGTYTIIDWSGIEENPIVAGQIYILCQKYKVPPNKVFCVALFANDLNESHRIRFERRQVFSNELAICEEDLNKRLELLAAGEDLITYLSREKTPKKTHQELIAEIEAIPEVVLELD